MKERKQKRQRHRKHEGMTHAISFLRRDDPSSARYIEYTVAPLATLALDLSDSREGPRLFANQIAGSYADARLAGIQIH